MIVIVDYGMGNLRSAQKGFEKAGFEAIVSENPNDVARAEGVVLPGVGAFGDCYDGLRQKGFVQPILDTANSGKPLLGICVGMQLLFDGSDEGGGAEGLGILPGRVVRFPDAAKSGLKVPHMGWNRLDLVEHRPCPLLEYATTRPYVYFVHSYFPVPSAEGIVYSTAEYGVRFAAIVGRGNIFATQFHPEKSQANGMAILRAFGEFVQHAAQSVRV